MAFSYFGLTGGIATGKSMAAGFFAALGARVIDADQVAHEVLLPSGAAFQAVVESFGREILDETGAIDRRKLGAIAFTDPQNVAQLNAITHPHILAQINRIASEFQQQDSSAVILVEAALIFEAGIEAIFRKIIVTWCRPEQQLERLILKSGLLREQAERRIAAQMPAEEKRRRADFVIDCSGTLEETRAQVGAIYPQLCIMV
ncbi:MAG TPA: dephospho-CoA kinase [Terriglobia bacterium]|nr:dephospho-CoA kinase [Terriglobia bacterium]